MRGRCADCGSHFNFTTSLTRGNVRRCKLHRDPGRVVDRRRSMEACRSSSSRNVTCPGPNETAPKCKVAGLKLVSDDPMTALAISRGYQLAPWAPFKKIPRTEPTRKQIALTRAIYGLSRKKARAVLKDRLTQILDEIATETGIREQRFRNSRYIVIQRCDGLSALANAGAATA
jgi:hypothetical protein